MPEQEGIPELALEIPVLEHVVDSADVERHQRHMHRVEGGHRKAPDLQEFRGIGEEIDPRHNVGQQHRAGRDEPDRDAGRDPHLTLEIGHPGLDDRPSEQEGHREQENQIEGDEHTIPFRHADPSEQRLEPRVLHGLEEDQEPLEEMRQNPVWHGE